MSETYVHGYIRQQEHGAELAARSLHEAIRLIRSILERRSEEWVGALEIRNSALLASHVRLGGQRKVRLVRT